MNDDPFGNNDNNMNDNPFGNNGNNQTYGYTGNNVGYDSPINDNNTNYFPQNDVNNGSQNYYDNGQNNINQGNIQNNSDGSNYHGVAIASLVCGILGCVLFCTRISMLLSFAAIVTSLIAKNNGVKEYTTAGLILRNSWNCY